ncbi:MAG TPA: hypothetical protein VKB67_14655 [Rhizomicrobium sp.]|nr:hypothetical protein [Rhizomicrobium sp.]
MNLRDAALVLVRTIHDTRRQGSEMDLVWLNVGFLELVYRSPFSARIAPLFPYELTVWAARQKVLNTVWANDGSLSIVSFTRGVWESELLAAACPGAQLRLVVPKVSEREKTAAAWHNELSWAS